MKKASALSCFLKRSARDVRSGNMGKSEIIMKHRRNEDWRKSWKNMKTAWKRILPARIKVMDHMGRQQGWVRQPEALIFRWQAAYWI